MKIPSIEELLEAGVHFGHQKSRWHPKMDQFIFTDRHGIHIIDLEETQKQLESVLNSVRQLAAEGKNILFVSTKPQARDIVKAGAIAAGMPYIIERWLGGMLTNFVEIKKLIKRYVSLKSQQANGELEKYTKQERIRIGKELEKMDTYLGGLSTIDAMPDAIFVPAVQREKTAVSEAIKTNVDIIGICDTNANPERVTYAIPGNDDAVKSIELLVGLVVEAIQEGKKEYENKKTLDKKNLVAKEEAAVASK